MTPEPMHSTATAPAERRQPVWPWLLLPLAALTMFFLLKTAKDSLPPNSAHDAEAPAAQAPSEDAESH